MNVVQELSGSPLAATAKRIAAAAAGNAVPK